MSYLLSDNDKKELEYEIVNTTIGKFKSNIFSSLLQLLDELREANPHDKKWESVLSQNPSYETRFKNMLTPKYSCLGQEAISATVGRVFTQYRCIVNTRESEKEQKEKFNGKTLMEMFLEN